MKSNELTHFINLNKINSHNKVNDQFHIIYVGGFTNRYKRERVRLIYNFKNYLRK